MLERDTSVRKMQEYARRVSALTAALLLLTVGIGLSNDRGSTVCSGENLYHRGDCAGLIVWDPGDVHFVDDVLNISWNTTLRVLAGARIFVDSSHGSGKIVVEGGGSLIIEGTAEAPVVISSNSSLKQPGDYVGIVVERGGNVVINHTNIRFATIGIESGSDDVSIRGCQINDTLDWGIKFTGDGASTMINTTINDTGDGGLFSGGLLLAGQSRVIGCEITNTSMTGIYVSSGNPVIRDTVVRNSTGNGLRIIGAADPDVIGCNISDTWTGNVYLSGSSRDITLRNCTIDNRTAPGVGDTIVIENTDEDHRIGIILLNTSYLNDTFDVEEYGNVTVKWHVNAFAGDGLGRAIPSANVSLRNSSGHLVHWKQTDSSGWAKYMEGVEFVYNAGGFFFDKYHSINATYTGCTGRASHLWIDGFNTTGITLTDRSQPDADAGADAVVDQHATVNFDGGGSSDNLGISNYTWLVDGINITTYGKNAAHRFDDAGTFTVILNVSDDAGNRDTDAMNVTVRDITDPVANAGADLFIDQGDNVTLDGTGSSDNVGIVNYTWTLEGFPVLRLFGAAPVHGPDQAGTYRFNLKVEDAVGNWNTDSVNLTVNDTTLPTAAAGANLTVDQGGTAVFNASGSGDNVGIVNYTWTIPDENIRLRYGVRAEYRFTRAGNFSVLLRVLDAAGNHADDSLTVNVNDTESPVSDAGPNRTVDQWDMTGLDGRGSVDNVGVTNYTWTFYDEGARTLFGPRPNYTFDRAGAFEITLAVRDSMGNPDEDTMTLTVRDREPPTAECGANRTVKTGTKVAFDARESTDNVGISNYTWNLLYNGSEIWLYGPRVTFDFRQNGTYAVTLLVNDEEGNSDSDSMTVIVTDQGKDGDGPGEGNGTAGSGKGRGSMIWLWVIIVIVLGIIGSAVFIYLDRRRRMSEGRKIDESEVAKITGGRIDFIILRKAGTKSYKKYELHRIQGVAGDVAGIFWDTARDSSWVIDRMITGSRETVASKFEFDITRSLDRGYSLDYFGTGLIIRLLGRKFQ